MSKITQPLKWHGGKHYLAPKIIELMPPRCEHPNDPDPSDTGWLHYVEPYFGGGSVLLANDPEGVSEVVNDLNGPLTGFWQCLMNPELFERFQRHVAAMPFSKQLFDEATKAQPSDVVSDAVAFFVRCRQSLSGRMKGFTGITRNRVRGGMNAEVSAWLGCIEGLPAVHARLKRVLILNDDALSVIRKEDGPRTLFYLDPPYLHETRSTTGEYAHEMSAADHEALLMLLKQIKGRFLLSGYRSDLYSNFERDCGWNRHEFEIDNKASGGKTKRKMIECVWTNY